VCARGTPERVPLRDVLVLCYHAVSPRWPAPLSVTPESFKRQLELLVRRGYRGATFHEAVSAPHAPKTLAVTFDDAYLSVLELGKPILDRLGLVGTVFVPTDYPDRDGPMAWPGIDHWLGGRHEPELRPLSWDQLAALADRGWEVGSHTRSHPHLTQIGEAELERELRGSREECERHIAGPCRTIAYPYGDYDARVAAAAGEAGYEAACTLPARFHVARPLEWPRVGVYHTDDERRFRLKVSPAVRRVRSSRAWEALDGLRRAIPARRSATVGSVSQ
jgi:peptidoglycan/xylan/chitin deacetylase (PgdA/CDA1 family)